MPKLDAIVDFDGSPGWVGAELEQTSLLEFAGFIERKTHRDEHEYKNYRDNRNAHKDISQDNADIAYLFLFRTIHILCSYYITQSAYA